MNRKILLLSMWSALFASAPLFAQDLSTFDPAEAKQLAGPPAEMATMRAASPVEATVHSRTALLPVHFIADRSGQMRWQADFPLERDEVSVLVFSGAELSTNWQLDMQVGSARMSARDAVASRVAAAEFGIEGATVPAMRYDYTGLQGDHFTLGLRAPAGASDGFVLVQGDAATELASYPTRLGQVVGEPLGVTALLTGGSADDKLQVGKGAGRIDSAQMHVTTPDGVTRSYPMFDDGQHQDGIAGDGLFGGVFPTSQVGQHVAQVEVRGVNHRGHAFVRTAEHALPVVEASLAIRPARVVTQASGDNRFAVRVPVEARAGGQHYRALAEVWGRDASGKELAVAWIGGMVQPNNGTLDIGFDPRWAQRVAAKGPFELRNLRIEDPDHFVTVAAAERLAFDLPAIGGKTLARNIVIDEMMTMGPRPQQRGDVTAGVGKRLLLVHGYCSSAVWPAAQFSTASSFLDAKQNRSNDAFAKLIKTYGAAWNSFGIVAHSQGGMASLHLYANYWSGLDNATGSRLIQSVGTPYKGTNVAGILAKIGGWFGVACSSNSNLTYSGATSWLAGIPNSSRSKVNYYTTSFTLTNWYTNDYCQIATDLVLSDPEDGTTEQVNAQLAGGVNRGHVTGQCHTTNMRDPAQYLNAARNATMNSNAAR